jgi:Carbohydrate-binding family 9
MSKPEYLIKRAVTPPALDGHWDGEAWAIAGTLTIGHFHPKSSEHRPVTQARVLYTPEGLHVIFRVQDRYVLSTRTEYQSHVCCDACVEFFVQPLPGTDPDTRLPGGKPSPGYFNFEMNCGGTLLLHYVTDPVRPDKDSDLAAYQQVPWELASRIQVFHSIPGVVVPEIEEDVEWVNQYFVPFGLFEPYVGPIDDVSGQVWYGNFYKCAEDCSHPHWATWAPIGEALNFHVPEYFAPLRFE